MGDKEVDGVMRATGSWRWTSYSMNNFLAPHLSELKAVEIPERSELAVRARTWVGNFHLRSMFGARVALEYVKLLFLFVRRSAAAVRCYESARLATAEFIANHSGTQPGIHRYTIAADHWEVFVSYAEQAADLLGRMEHEDGQRFVKGDGSVLERLHGIHSDAKHATARTRPDPSQAEAAFSVWMEPDGLRSTNHHLTWNEAAGLLDKFGDFILMLEAAAQDHGRSPAG